MMRWAPLRWLVKNLGTLLLAFILAVIVWVSAVWAADPNEAHVLERIIPIEFIGQSPNLQLIGSPQESVVLTLNAPSSVWTELNSNPESVRAWVDLTGLDAGEYMLPVQIQIAPRLVRLVSQDPEQVAIELEPLVTQTFPITVQLVGAPPTGYQAESPVITPASAVVTGPESLVAKVKGLRAVVDINGENETVNKTLSPVPYDEDGRMVNDLVVTPDRVQVSVPINLLGGFRYVIVKPVTVGLVANGYKLTNIYVTPAGLVVFSSNPQLLDELPGYVETKPIDLTNASDDFETLVELNLPESVSAVGDPKVLVQVSISAIESSLAVSLPVEVVGLTPGLQAVPAPQVVDIILSGPVPVLNDLQPTDIRVKVDLTGLGVGVYQLIPVVDILPENVSIVSILPATIEVTVTQAPTPTPTISPSSAAFIVPKPSITPTPTPAP
jgi:YbbR domain-containing protein